MTVKMTTEQPHAVAACAELGIKHGGIEGAPFRIAAREAVEILCRAVEVEQE